MPFIALAIGALIVAADQIIKYFVNTGLKPVGEVSVIDGLFKLVYVENRGVAFGGQVLLHLCGLDHRRRYRQPD